VAPGARPTLADTDTMTHVAFSLPVLDQVKQLLGETLKLGERWRRLDAATPLFGSLPELDSLAVVNVIGALEEHFGIGIDDDDINADVFETVGSVARLVESKLADR
jgi:acyl carrier protein